MNGKRWATAAAVTAAVLLAYHFLSRRQAGRIATNAGVDAMTATIDGSPNPLRVGAPPIWALQSGTGEPAWALTPNSTPKDYLYTFPAGDNPLGQMGSILVGWTNPYYRYLSGFDRPTIGFLRVNPPWPKAPPPINAGIPAGDQGGILPQDAPPGA